jgi:hypothetical protein
MAMMSKSHKVTARRAFDLLMDEDVKGQVYLATGKDKEDAIKSCGEADYFHDLEFINVWGDPDEELHSDELDEIDDESHREALGMNFTAFNHFIDIRKGAGLYDDFDGYSYFHGSGHKLQYQYATDLVDSHASSVSPTGTLLDGAIVNGIWGLVWLSGKAVDQAIMWYFNDEYVHAPGHSGYVSGNRGCSPSLERYSFFRDKGTYSKLDDEMAHRFPKGDSAGQGVANSVFMPVDNMGRYWYQRYISPTGYAGCLGAALHAIQDASIPHHAGGCLGNWHAEYEDDLDQNSRIKFWLADPDIYARAKALVLSWAQNDQDPPARIGLRQAGSLPGKKWKIEQLVTWMALQAYDAYKNIYANFRDGYSINEENMKDLTCQALALSTLVLIKATEDKPQRFIGDRQTKVIHKKECKQAKSIAAGQKEYFTTVKEATDQGYRSCVVCLLDGIKELLPGYIGNLNTGELHNPQCRWVEKISKEHVEVILSAREALSRGYNGCFYCLQPYNTD